VRIESQRIPCSCKSYPFSAIKDDPRCPRVDSDPIRTKIRGVTKTNADGTRRQQVIKSECHAGDALYFAREPTNVADPNAIKVLRVVCSDVPDKPQLGAQLGYLSRELARKLAPKMDNDKLVLMGQITEVTGGDYGRSFGVNIQVVQYDSAILLSGDAGQHKK
jgi:hypothetical protein